jgi:outer membrane murein-binding lipoprotein Lpp
MNNPCYIKCEDRASCICIQQKEENKETGESEKVPDGTATAKEDKAAERAKTLEDRKAALEEKKKKIIADREAAKKAREDKKNQPKEEPKKEE